jgi:hypothetical protein
MPVCNNVDNQYPNSVMEFEQRIYYFIWSTIENTYMPNDQEPYENVRRVFWIKFELRENPRKVRQDLGEIREVVSGEKIPIKDLVDIIDFIIPYIEKMGIQINWFWRFTIWLKKL